MAACVAVQSNCNQSARLDVHVCWLGRLVPLGCRPGFSGWTCRAHDLGQLLMGMLFQKKVVRLQRMPDPAAWCVSALASGVPGWSRQACKSPGAHMSILGSTQQRILQLTVPLP